MIKLFLYVKSDYHDDVDNLSYIRIEKDKVISVVNSLTKSLNTVDEKYRGEAKIVVPFKANCTDKDGNEIEVKHIWLVVYSPAFYFIVVNKGDVFYESDWVFMDEI